MSEDEDLKRQIAHLAGRINQHKRQASAPPPSYGYNQNWAPYRGSPYGVRRGGRHPTAGYRNRTLVLNNGNAGTNQGHTVDADRDTQAQSDSATSTSGWVSKRERHMQLINTSVFDKLNEQRNQDIERTQAALKRTRDAKEMSRLAHHFSNSESAQDLNEGRKLHQEIDVNGVRFRLQHGGSRLIRTSDDPNITRLVPKSTKIAGVTFVRSKHGNLYRAGLVKAETRKPKSKSQELCPTFSSSGTCSRGPNCRFTHDAMKVAICKDFLAKGTCALGDHCDLSHEPTANRVPACIHFLRGNCTNDDCRYAHVKVSPNAPVCRQFAVLGYCDKGETCEDRHVTECPNYASKGICRTKNCRLPHIDRAGKLRKAANAQAQTSANEDSSSDLTSDEEDISDDIDSDEDLLIVGLEGAGKDLSNNQDFVNF